MAAAEEITLPVLDIAAARDPQKRLEVAKGLVEALETVGFLYVDNVPGFDQDKLLEVTRWFFGLAESNRMAIARRLWNQKSPNAYRGYFPVIPGEVSHKEGFEIGQDDLVITDQNEVGVPVHPFFTEHNLWPDHNLPGSKDFKAFMNSHFKAMLDCAVEILRLISLAYGLEESWFEPLFAPDTLSTLRLMHYPKRPDAPPKAVVDGVLLSTASHSDSGVVTLLSTFDYKGLEIKPLGSKRWLAVPERKGSLVMNIGDILAGMSGGRLISTIHRVLDIGKSRFSVPFFLEPRFAGDIRRLMPGKVDKTMANTCAKEAVRTGTTQPGSATDPSPENRYYGPWLINKIRGFAEYRETFPMSTPPCVVENL